MNAETIVLMQAGVLAGLGAAALVWVLAAIPRGQVEATHDRDPGWWTWGLRLAAVVAGVGLGLAQDWSVAGACVGAGGGLCSTTIIGVVKARLRALRGDA